MSSTKNATCRPLLQVSLVKLEETYTNLVYLRQIYLFIFSFFPTVHFLPKGPKLKSLNDIRGTLGPKDLIKIIHRFFFFKACQLCTFLIPPFLKKRKKPISTCSIIWGATLSYDSFGHFLFLFSCDHFTSASQYHTCDYV